MFGLLTQHAIYSGCMASLRCRKYHNWSHHLRLCAVIQSLENNRRIQRQNNAPQDFPAFVRQGYDIKIMADGYEIDSKGLIYKVGLGFYCRIELHQTQKGCQDFPSRLPTAPITPPHRVTGGDGVGPQLHALSLWCSEFNNRITGLMCAHIRRTLSRALAPALRMGSRSPLTTQLTMRTATA